MNCLEFRRQLGAEPGSHDAGFIGHRDSCRTCAAAWREAQSFEQTLRQSLTVDVPDGLADRVLLAQATAMRQHRRHGRRHVLALAACVLLVLAGGGLIWRRAGHGQHLANLAVAHMPPEMASLKLVRPVADAMIVADFADRGLSLPGPIPADTTYVRRCIVGPYEAVHLVTRAGGEPVVVLYMPHKQVRSERRFTREGWHGMEVPLEHGSMVVLTNRDNRKPLIDVARAWKRAIEGNAPPRQLAALRASTRPALRAP